MEKTYSMQSRIRFLQGRVDVNYYNDDTSNEANYVEKTGDFDYIKHYARQIVNGGLAMDKKIAVLGEQVDSGINDVLEYADEPEEFEVVKEETKIKIINRQVKSYANCRLNESCVLCGVADSDIASKDTNREMYKKENNNGKPVQAVALGWFGSQISDGEGFYENDDIPKLTMQYSAPREIDHMVISGYNARDEYPLEFKLVYYEENSEEPCEVTYLDKKFFETRITEIERDGKENFKRRDFILYFEPVIAKRMELQIYRWSAAYTVPKINYFASEHIECYLGDKLKSISIVEEKTGDTDKLSYGISSNSCNFEFLNENKRFYYNKDYNLLRKNRRVYPYIRCGKGEFSQPLGVFYSDEWKIEDGNPYVSCKAYDVLYPLQDLTINYGMVVNGSTIRPYTNQTIKEIFDRVFELINDKRQENGIFSKVEHKLYLGDMAEKVIPLVLIEEKSAWDVLQDLANLTCSYIYCDRTGTVIVKCDDFTEPSMGHNQAKQLVSVNPSNSFSYSLPVISQTVVNSVNTEYYELEEVTEEEKPIDIKDYLQNKNTSKGNYTITATIDLDKIYLEITSIDFNIEVSAIKIIYSSYKKLTVEFDTNNQLSDSFSIRLCSKKRYSFVKNNIINRAETIDKYGLRDFNYKAENLLLSPKINIGEPYDESKVFNYQNKVGKILNKYKNGVTFVDAEWIGDYNLTLGSNFFAKSQYDDDGIEEIYECMSSEITYDTRFKQKLKGREVVEIASN